MLHRAIMVTLAGFSIASCGQKPTAPTGNDHEGRAVAVAGSRTVPHPDRSTESALPLEPPPVLDPWMKLPPGILKAQVDRVLQCGASRTSPRKCNLYYHEGAWAQSPAEDGAKPHYSIRIWMTIPVEVYGSPPTHSLPQAPYRVIRHLLPHWRQADAWLTYALRNARNKCGMQTRVGNALVAVSAEFGIDNTYIVTLDLEPFRSSLMREYVDCYGDMAALVEINRHAEALSAGLRRRGSGE